MPEDFAEQCVRYMLNQYQNSSSSFDFIKQLEQLTGMNFLATPSNAESLCYANTEAVRDDYKIAFTTADLWAYVNHHAKHLQANTDFTSFLPTIFPQTSQQFWQDVHQNQN